MISSYSQTLAFGLSVNIATRVETPASSPRSTARYPEKRAARPSIT